MHWIFQKSENTSKVQLATLSSLGFRTVYSVSSQELAFSAILLKVTLKNIQLQVWHHIHPEFFFPGNYLPCLHINWKLQVKMPFLQFLCPGTIFFECHCLFVFIHTNQIPPKSHGWAPSSPPSPLLPNVYNIHGTLLCQQLLYWKPKWTHSRSIILCSICVFHSPFAFHCQSGISCAIRVYCTEPFFPGQSPPVLLEYE